MEVAFEAILGISMALLPVGVLVSQAKKKNERNKKAEILLNMSSLVFEIFFRKLMLKISIKIDINRPENTLPD
tara:strand:+ start:20632 stop:20850 length:219 start_codon:yes stop_codon:yes gene_type:complete